ncbi:MAG TPA: NAD kinase [Mycobacteriales bacterium]|jgi:NAD+ kinase|nr:NAD kinase [Mycobacteriales bacterium]
MRELLLIAHTGRPEAVTAAHHVVERLTAEGLAVRVLDREAAELNCPQAKPVAADQQAAEGAELVLALGGDGTLLRAADYARGADVPLLGVNLGRVGFLAEAERADLAATIDHVLRRDYLVEERMTLDVVARPDDGVETRDWALNDVSVEKHARERMLDLVVEVDGRPLSRWAGDGVVCATPTGSTAYAFSAGGPVVWPQVEALLCVPISAHALFSKPLVVAPDSVVAIELLAHTAGGVMWCDGRRTTELTPGARIEVRRGKRPVRLARLARSPFTDRLVAKFGLPVQGWRGSVLG